MMTLALLYLLGVLFYSFYLSYRLGEKDVPVYRILVYSFFCPWFFITHLFCWFLTYFKVHVIYYYSIETNTPNNSDSQKIVTDNE